MTDWESRARDLLISELHKRRQSDATTYGSVGFEVRAALQLGQEMADARAEEIALYAESLINNPGQGSQLQREACARVLRIVAVTARQKQTREQALEQALIEIIAETASADWDKDVRKFLGAHLEIAKRALNWKPSD